MVQTALLADGGRYLSGKAVDWMGRQGGVFNSLDSRRPSDALEQLEAQLAEQIEEAARYSSADPAPSQSVKGRTTAAMKAPPLQGESACLALL